MADAIPKLDHDRMAAACACIESIASNNRLVLEQHYGTSADDVRAVVMMARAWHYREGKDG